MLDMEQSDRAPIRSEIALYVSGLNDFVVARRPRSGALPDIRILRGFRSGG
jgi:hypothetical protein